MRRLIVENHDVVTSRNRHRGECMICNEQVRALAVDANSERAGTRSRPLGLLGYRCVEG
jgi:hypothetical protein